jgi:hypothetical protein
MHPVIDSQPKDLDETKNGPELPERSVFDMM